MASPDLLRELLAFAAVDDGSEGAYRSPLLEEKRNLQSTGSGDSDIVLVERLRRDDEQALDEIIDRYGERLLTIARIVTGSRDLAWDVVQDALVSVWDTRHTLQLRHRFLNYLQTIVRRRAIDVLRHERMHHRLGESLRGTLPTSARNEGPSAVQQEELLALVHRALEGLPSRCREIFLLNREAGLSYAEIEGLLGISNATIRNQMSRAAKHIASLVESGYFD